MHTPILIYYIINICANANTEVLVQPYYVIIDIFLAIKSFMQINLSILEFHLVLAKYLIRHGR